MRHGRRDPAAGHRRTAGTARAGDPRRHGYHRPRVRLEPLLPGRETVSPARQRLLLLLPTATYRATAFVAAARRCHADLTVASEQPSTFEAARPDALLTLDFADRGRCTSGALAFHARQPVTAALGVDDDTAVLAAAINGALGRPANSVAAAERARDKQLQRVACAAAEVPVPASRLHDLDDPIPSGVHFPCVVKPLRLAASRGVIRANDPAELAAALRRVRAILAGSSRLVLIEDFVPGVEVALEGLVQDGRLHVLALFDKPDPLDGPFFEESIYVTPSRLAAPVQEAIARVTQRAVDALGLIEGPIHAELRVNARGPWLIELAARPIGGRCSAALRFADGATLEDIVCCHALGVPLPSLERAATASGVMMIPVPGAGVLREVRGLPEARSLPLIEGIDITAHPGERLVPWPEGSRYPGFIFAAGSSPQAVEAALRQAYTCLEFVLEPPGVD